MIILPHDHVLSVASLAHSDLFLLSGLSDIQSVCLSVCLSVFASAMDIATISNPARPVGCGLVSSVRLVPLLGFCFGRFWLGYFVGVGRSRSFA